MANNPNICAAYKLGMEAQAAKKRGEDPRGNMLSCATCGLAVRVNIAGRVKVPRDSKCPRYLDAAFARLRMEIHSKPQ